MSEVCSPMPIAAAFPKLDEKLRKLVLLDAETLRRGEVLRDFDDQPEVRKMYVDAWDKVKAGE